MPGVHIPQEAANLPTYMDLAGRLEKSGYDRLWVGEINDVDAVTAATLAATGTERAQVAEFLNVFTRSPTTLAMTAATLAALAPGRAEITLGVGSPLFAERWNGIPYERVHERLRDTLRFLRQALAGERVRADLATIRSDGFSLASPPDPPPGLVLAATGPRALELAAAEADGVILNWIAPSDLDRVGTLPDDRGAVSLVVAVCPTPDRAVMERRMRHIMTTYLNVPAYESQQRRLGRGEALEQMWSAWAAGDRTAAMAALPGGVIDELVVWGDPAACRDRLREIEREFGVRTIATFHLPPGVAFEDVALA